MIVQDVVRLEQSHVAECGAASMLSVTLDGSGSDMNIGIAVIRMGAYA